MAQFWGWFGYKKPEWEVEYEFFQMKISERTGLSKEKLDDVIKVFKEYKILKEEE